jgi:Pentapeptide repeats (8 copies)
MSIMVDVPEPHDRRRPGRTVTMVAGGVLLLAVLAGLLFLPGWLVDRDIGGQQVGGVDRLRAINDVRNTLLQAVAGLAVGVGAYATWRRLRINEEELRISRDGQITERYSRAVEHLGSATVDVRMGGVHALHRIARNSVDDRETIARLLCAFVRSKSPWPPGPDQPAPGMPPSDLSSLATRANDVQEAIRVVSQLHAGTPDITVYLPRTDLRYAWLGGMDLSGANLGHTGLCRARFGGADLRAAILVAADMRQCDLRGADLRGAQLTGADLTGALADPSTAWPDGFDPAVAAVAVVT